MDHLNNSSLIKNYNRQLVRGGETGPIKHEVGVGGDPLDLELNGDSENQDSLPLDKNRNVPEPHKIEIKK